MPEQDAIDFSFAHIPADAIVAAGYKGVFRYLAWKPNGKVIERDEYLDLKAHGLFVFLNWETTALRPLSGASGGHQDGIEANRQADSLGAPHSGPESIIFFSLDADDRGLSSSWPSLVEQYLRAAGSHGRPVGIYGSSRVCEEMYHRGAAAAFWQTQAWSGTYVSPIANFYQRVGRTHTISGIPLNAYDEDVIIHIPGVEQTWPKPIVPAPITKGNKIDMQIVEGLVDTKFYGFGQFVGVLECNAPVKRPVATVLGPDPHFADPASKDDDWEFSREATVRAQARGTKVVVVVNAPNWKTGDPTPSAHVVAFV